MGLGRRGARAHEKAAGPPSDLWCHVAALPRKPATPAALPALPTCQAQALAILLERQVAHQAGQVLGQLLRRSGTDTETGQQGSAHRQAFQHTERRRKSGAAKLQQLNTLRSPVLACIVSSGSAEPLSAALRMRCAAWNPRFFILICRQAW